MGHGSIGSSAAATLRQSKAEVGRAIAALVVGWPKYAAQYEADPEAFAQLEAHALVDYVAAYAETGDATHLDLYIGEKAKQFYDPASDEGERRAREARILEGEREAFDIALRDLDGARAIIKTFFDRAETVLVTTVPKAEVKVLLVGDCLYLDVITFLTAPAIADGIRLRPTFVTTHDPAETRAKIAALRDEKFDLVAYSPLTYAFPSDYEALQRPRSALRGSGALIRRSVEEAVATFDTIADFFECPIVVHAPAPVLRHEGTFKDRLRAAVLLPGLRAATAQLGKRLRGLAAERADKGQVVHVLDEAACLGDAGLWEAGRYVYKSAIQHPARFGALLAPYYRDLVFVAGRLLKRKLVACDLDNTLWDGVIGEGLGVTHFRERHAPLRALKVRGVVLAINSKNDPAKAVWEPAEGLLSLDDFVSRQVNWDPKPLNIRRIAEHLNLKEKDFVFVDDRPDERAMVEGEYPALAAVDATDPRTWRLFQLWADLLPAKPGADRTEFYRQRDAREAFIAQEGQDSGERKAKLYGELGLKLSIREASAAELDRATDLINRTNQFNMTGARVSKRQVTDLAESPESRVLVAEAADRFGEMGIISVLVAARSDGVIDIPAYVLSCRVFGYGMEFAILEAARSLAGQGDRLAGKLVETPVNQPCREVYRDAGFVADGDSWVIANAAAAAIPVPGWLAVDTSVRPFGAAESSESAGEPVAA